MQPDQEICLCFHVTQRKVVNFIRVEKPRRVSQLSECGGAGTGCGWCRPFLQKLFEREQPAPPTGKSEMGSPSPLPGGVPWESLSAEDYARARETHIRAGKGSPPRE